MWTIIGSLPRLESAHYRLIGVSFAGDSPIIGGHTRTLLLTPPWPCKCLSCWKNVNLRGASRDRSAYHSSAVSPDLVPLFHLFEGLSCVGINGCTLYLPLPITKRRPTFTLSLGPDITSYRTGGRPHRCPVRSGMPGAVPEPDGPRRRL